MNDYAALHEPIIPALRLLLQTISLEPGAFVLDLASGSGEKLPLLREILCGARIVALDRDRHAIAHMQPHAIPAVVGDAHQLPLRDGSCDCVVCIAALGMFADQPAALREMHRVLRSNRQVLLVTAGQRWARVRHWPSALAGMFTTLPPAHADHAEAAARMPLAAGFVSATSFAVPLAEGNRPVAAALSLLDWAQVAPQVARLPPQTQLACEEAHANAEIELCDMCLATLVWKA